jgi:hypothetical protein
MMPVKPARYTRKHPKTICQALKLYANQRTVTNVETCADYMHQHNWPLPLWWDPEHIKVGFFNRLYYRRFYNSMGKARFKAFKAFDFLWMPFIAQFSFKIKVDDCLEEAFEANKKYIRQRLKTHPILCSKKDIIDAVFHCYEKKNWIACISTLFPLIDVVARTFLHTNNLSADVSKIGRLFRENGFSGETVDHLMPFVALSRLWNPERRATQAERDAVHEKVKDNQFGVIGPALSSFLRFAELYYGYYRADTDPAPVLLNRHAILHGSVDSFGDKINVIKLLSFLFLFLELEGVFAILFDESS